MKFSLTVKCIHTKIEKPRILNPLMHTKLANVL